jgi:hypothetical protein
MTWLSAALPYVGGGVLGAGVTHGLTWVRERRRTLDAYRAPQRQALGEIITATHSSTRASARWCARQMIGCHRQRHIGTLGGGAGARGRLGKLYQRLHAVDTPDVAPQPHY